MANWRDGPDQKVRTTLEQILLESQAASQKAMWSARVSFVLTTIAVIAAVLSAYYARLDSIDDTAWRQKQLEYLSDIKNETTSINEKLTWQPNAPSSINAEKESSLKIDEPNIDQGHSKKTDEDVNSDLHANKSLKTGTREKQRAP